VEDPAEEITLRVWDQDMSSSDAVGFTKIKMSSLIINCGVEEWFTVNYENKSAGEILITTTFHPKGGDLFAQMEDKMEEQKNELEA